MELLDSPMQRESRFITSWDAQRWRNIRCWLRLVVPRFQRSCRWRRHVCLDVELVLDWGLCGSECWRLSTPVALHSLLPHLVRSLPFQSTCKVEVDSSVAVFGLGAVVSAQC